MRPGYSFCLIAPLTHHFHRRILSTFFKTKNVDYEEACDGAEAFERYKAAHSAGRPFFLFATDVQMPVCDGIECSRLIRAYEAQHGLEPIKIVRFDLDYPVCSPG